MTDKTVAESANPKLDRSSSNEKLILEACMLKNLGQAVIATNKQGIIIYWNCAAEKMYGWKETQMIGKHIAELFDPLIIERDPVVLERIRKGLPWTGEATFKRPDGTLFGTLLSTTPILDKEGRYHGVVGALTDISELKWMRQVTEDAVKKVSDLNEKLQIMASLTRHDIRNKLMALNGNMYLLKKQLDQSPNSLKLLKTMETISQQIQRILEFQRLYATIGTEESCYVSIEKMIWEAESLFHDLKGVKIINQCKELIVLADSLLQQLFYNLIDNTLKYAEKATEIIIRFERGKDHLLLIYEDNGIGIDDKMRSKLFTEGYGKGTGYGLYLIKRIAEAYGWTIQETGKLGKGAQFIMKIPNMNADRKELYKIS